MKRRGLFKRSLAFLLMSVMTVGLVSYMPNDVSKVQAEETKTIAGLGTSAIANPTSSEDKWSGSYVYFGTYNESPVKYRVLNNKTSVFGGTTMLLDCDSVLENMRFDENSRAWQYSEIRKKLTGESESFLTKSFSAIEQNAIATSSKTAVYAGDANGSGKDGEGSTGFEWTNLTGEKIFLLDAVEATNESYGYSSDNSRKKTGCSGNWWLRSPNKTKAGAGYVSSGGVLSTASYSLSQVSGISPALNIDLSSVLFSSEILDSENRIEGYKLTLIDKTAAESKLKIALNGSVTRTDNEITIPYTLSGEDATNVNQVSVLITKNKYESGNANEAKVLYYSKLTLSEGNGTFTLPSDSNLNLSDQDCGKDYYAYIVAEIVKGKYETDYASEPCQIEIPSKPWEAPTVNIINIGASAIRDPAVPVDTTSAWTGCYVYFGTYGGNSVKYRVLSNGTTTFNSDGQETMLLDCDSVLMQRVFNSSNASGNNIWSSSDIKKYLNSEGNYSTNGFLTSSFSTVEQAAIANSTKTEIATDAGDSTTGGVYKEQTVLPYTALNGEKIFFLDAAEVNNPNYGYSDTLFNTKATNRNKTGAQCWWLRSADVIYTERGACAGCVRTDKGGYVGTFWVNTTNPSLGASPAFNINLSSVLFSSWSEMSKTSVISTDSSRIAAKQVKEWKLTILDSEKSVGIQNNETVTKDSNGTIKVPYTYSDVQTQGVERTTAETVNQISVMITNQPYKNDGAKILYYGKLNTTLNNTGTGTFTLPSDLSGKTLGSDYHVYILAEHVSAEGESKTDYASEPEEIVLITDAPDTPSTTDTDDSNSSSSDTNTGSTTTVSADTSNNNVANNTVSTKKNNGKKTSKTDTTTEPVKEEVKEESSSKDDKETKQDSKKDNSEVKENQIEEESAKSIIKEASEILGEDKTELDDAVEKIRKVDENIQPGLYVLPDTDEISFDIPDELKADNRTYYLVTVDENGNIEILQNESTEEGKFEAVGKANTVYQIIFEDGETPLAAMISDTGILEEPESDNRLIWPWIVLGVLVVGGFIFFIIYKKRKEDEEQPSA